MHPKYHLQKILLFIFLLLAHHAVKAQDHVKSTCDSLIRSGIDALEKNNHTQSLELLFKAHTLAKKNALDSQEFLALNNIGTNYLRLSENGEALNYFLEAYNIAVRKLAPGEEIKALNNIAIIYFKEKKYNQAKSYFTRVYNTAKKIKDNNTATTAAINLGTLAVETKNIGLAKTYYNEAILLAINKPEYANLAKGGLANCYLLEGHTKAARQLAQHILEITGNPEYYNIETELLLIIAKSYVKENNPDMALVYVNKVFDKKPNLETKTTLFTQLSEISLKKNRPDLALMYKDSLYNTTARFNEINDKRLFENSKVKFELQKYKNQYALNETKLANERKIFYYMLLFVIIIIGFILWTARNLSLKLKQKKLIAERNEHILALELEKEKSESLLLEKQFNEEKAISDLVQEKLKNEVELKNRKLSAKALYLTGRNEIIEEILSELQALPQVANDKPLKAQMKSLKNQLKSDKEWDRFITHFEEVNQGFLTVLKMKHTNLTVNDIRYISYIYMNLSTKEIASMLNITPESCRKRKERILAKLGLSKETNVYHYLASL
ncbi:hypothetical protein FNO01nite_29320 [Flavobacterium noncentrifugens]|uniref:Tetratricopeptide repeat-containing protein n=1 Tax=Flavobacterium noncentrifugens TaxID=1128970 RepID=A0A1G8Y0A6_9FLAO|nr:tetratricopeptide repeat protein [Flavobacterium noncentrifugens]GEP52260.1 hypothetical protein FNO01nite_29320 [Flavobacterium noncentrifugens]SDJ96191.1 Tetratricopeptide repeat-containing protein [Flavobacterium noncentrifugens]